ncbi:MAG: hypothetical protein IJO68_06275 [Clostridia bacterium]|nr:hypothetical protein [Clostridia bacterium]
MADLIILYTVLSVFLLYIVFLLAEVAILLRKKTKAVLPSEEEAEYYSKDSKGRSFEDLFFFLNNEPDAPYFSDSEIYDMLLRQCEYVNRRFDCADFRLQLLIKIYIDFPDSLPCDSRELIKKTLLGFKYHMDEPGEDSMCYWSENHQIMFAAAEYLTGQLWPDEIFTNDNNNGKYHRQKAKNRIEHWMKQRFYYGFSEYLSNNYLAEDISPMANLIAYSDDQTLINRISMIMDILWLDIALYSVNNRFTAVSPRMYGNNKSGDLQGNSIKAAMNVLWGEETYKKLSASFDYSETEKAIQKESFDIKPNYILICFTEAVKNKKYILPDAIRKIALNDGSFIAKSHSGLSPEDLKNEDLIGPEVYQIMAQFGAEAFTNPEVISNTISYLKKNRMFSNDFLSYFRFLTVSLFKVFSPAFISDRFNILPHGIATRSGNIYAYKSMHFSLITDIMKYPYECGTQDHIWTANISDSLTLFTTHPSGDGNSRFSSSPGYWIGNGRKPSSVQHENINITVYKLPDKKRFGESSICKLTHAYVPKELYDEFELYGNRFVARKNGVFVSMIADGQLRYKEYNKDSLDALFKGRPVPSLYPEIKHFDLCRNEGDYHCYITEISDISRESYENFKTRIRNNKYSFTDNGCVFYSSEEKTLSFSFDGGLYVNGELQKASFDRYECEFCRAKRKADEITVRADGASLYLNFNENQRITLE